MTGHPYDLRDFTGPDYDASAPLPEVGSSAEANIFVRAARVGVNVLKLVFDTANADY